MARLELGGSHSSLLDDSDADREPAKLGDISVTTGASDGADDELSGFFETRGSLFDLGGSRGSLLDLGGPTSPEEAPSYVDAAAVGPPTTRWASRASCRNSDMRPQQSSQELLAGPSPSSPAAASGTSSQPSRPKGRSRFKSLKSPSVIAAALDLRSGYQLAGAASPEPELPGRRRQSLLELAPEDEEIGLPRDGASPPAHQQPRKPEPPRRRVSLLELVDEEEEEEEEVEKKKEEAAMAPQSSLFSLVGDPSEDDEIWVPEVPPLPQNAAAPSSTAELTVASAPASPSAQPQLFVSGVPWLAPEVEESSVASFGPQDRKADSHMAAASQAQLAAEVGAEEKLSAHESKARDRAYGASAADGVEQVVTSLRHYVTVVRRLEEELAMYKAESASLRRRGSNVHSSVFRPSTTEVKQESPKQSLICAGEGLDVARLPRRSEIMQLTSSTSVSGNRSSSCLSVARHSMPVAGGDMESSRTAKSGSRHAPRQSLMLLTMDELRSTIRKTQNMSKKSLSDYQKKDGWVVKVSQSPALEILTYFVIAFNILWMAIDVDLNTKPPLEQDAVFTVLDSFFSLYFIAELALRLFAFKRKRDCTKDPWFLFDLLLVVLNVLETWVLLVVLSFIGSAGQADVLRHTSLMRILRTIRVIRVARIYRLLVALPELLVLFKGMAYAARAVTATLGLLVVIVFIFSILFRTITRGTALEKTVFPSILGSMAQLLISSTTPDLMPLLLDQLGVEYLVYAILYYLFVMMITFTVLNLLVGVLVNVVSIVATVEREMHQMNTMRQDLANMVLKIDEDEDHMISKHEFQLMLNKPEVVQTLHEANIDGVDLAEFCDMLFVHEEDLIPFRDMLDFILSLRGGNPSTVRDIVSMRRFVTMLIGQLRRDVEDSLRDFRRGPAPRTQDLPYSCLR